MSSRSCRGGCVEPIGSRVARHGRFHHIQGGEEVHGDRCQPFLILGRQEILGFWE